MIAGSCFDTEDGHDIWTSEWDRYNAAFDALVAIVERVTGEGDGLRRANELLHSEVEEADKERDAARDGLSVANAMLMDVQAKRDALAREVEGLRAANVNLSEQVRVLDSALLTAFPDEDLRHDALRAALAQP